jgi:hypothetical protein
MIILGILILLILVGCYQRLSRIEKENRHANILRRQLLESYNITPLI